MLQFSEVIEIRALCGPSFDLTYGGDADDWLVLKLQSQLGAPWFSL